MVEPIEAHIKGKLPIVALPNEVPKMIKSNIDALNIDKALASNSDIAITLTRQPDSKNIASNTDSKVECWLANYLTFYQGWMRKIAEVEHPFYTIYSGLSRAFNDSDFVILILKGYAVAFISEKQPCFDLFDPHARDKCNILDANECAVVLKYDKLHQLENWLSNFSFALNTNLFELVPVTLKLAYNAKRHMRVKRMRKTKQAKQK